MLRDSREWTTIASSKTWAGSATNLWTRCPRQAWPHSSLMIKHYRVLVGNHRLGYRSPYISHMISSYDGTFLLEQINQWLGVLGIHIEWRLQVSKPQNTSHVCMTDLGWFHRKQNNFLKLTVATYINYTYIKESLFSHPTYTSWTGHEGNAYKVSNTSLMSYKIMEKVAVLLMGSTTIHPGFHGDGIP
jgi:hypothetical protein